MLIERSDRARLEAGERALPLCISAEPRADLAAWTTAERASIDAALVEHGALLFRGFDVSTDEAFGRTASVLCGQPLDYMYRSTPRTAVGDKLYTATEYRADAVIPFHNENAFQRDWPTRIAFCCIQPAASGGETPLVDVVRVTNRLDPGIVRVFAEKGVMYVRNYGQGVDLPWQTVFQTDRREDVEAYCDAHDIAWEWLPDDRLRTWQVCQAVATHPITQVSLWFNQAHLFHVSSLGDEKRAVMLELFDEADLPRHAYYGDGARIEDETLDHIRACYDAEAVSFAWERGDVLLADNMRVAHGRAAYTGSRRVLVAMGDLYSTIARPERQRR
jgi:alpha-ketoglutarate-dependent taurine dioxygenase